MVKGKLKIAYPHISKGCKIVYNSETSPTLYDGRWNYGKGHPVSMRLLELIQEEKLPLDYLHPVPNDSMGSDYQGRLIKKTYEMPVGVSFERSIDKSFKFKYIHEGNYLFEIVDYMKGKPIEDEEFDKLLYWGTKHDQEKINETYQCGLGLRLPNQNRVIRIKRGYNLRTLIEDDETFQIERTNLFEKIRKTILP